MSDSEPSVPEPSVPEPSVPEPSVPEPSVPEPSVPEPSPLELGQAAAARIGGDEWELDAEIPFAVEEPFADEEPAAEEPAAEEPAAEPAPIHSPPSPPLAKQAPVANTEPPPEPDQILEAMLFVGGHPLSAETACRAIRGLKPEQFEEGIDRLNRRYRRQGRPYAIQPRDGGHVMAIVPAFRGLRERLFSGPREARLNPAAIDVLAVVAYRQPVGKAEVDALRGVDSGATLRQLVRLGLIAVQHRAEAESREVRYGTTHRFLHVFGLGSLEELPRLGETSAV